jgi:heat-inducible transcriptional repressor
MGSEGATTTGETLRPRDLRVLRSVIDAHISTGEPVASGAVSRRRRVDLSPASVRAVMAELERRGLLVQPHTSAGRVPTDSAYRVYVDRLMPRTSMKQEGARRIDAALVRHRGEVTDLLGEASRQLSRFSHQVGLVLAPDIERTVIDRLEFVRLAAGRIMAILVDRSGVVQNRVVEPAEDVEQPELDRIGRYLTDELGGRTLPEVRAELLRRMSEERATYDRLMRRSLELGRRAVDAPDSGGDVFVEGASNLLDSPEFSDVERMRDLLRTLEEKHRLVDLLGRLLQSEGVQVVIGEENPVAALAGCSLVASAYGADDRVMGTVGVVGPTRMEYSKAVALVGYLSSALSRMLTHDDGD